MTTASGRQFVAMRTVPECRMTGARIIWPDYFEIMMVITGLQCSHEATQTYNIWSLRPYILKTYKHIFMFKAVCSMSRPKFLQYSSTPSRSRFWQWSTQLDKYGQCSWGVSTTGNARYTFAGPLLGGPCQKWRSQALFISHLYRCVCVCVYACYQWCAR